MYWTPPNVLMISPDVLMISPNVLMVSPRCTEHPPMYSWFPPHVSWCPSDVLNIPWCTHDIPPMYSWYPSNVLNIPRCTHGIPPMYWTPPDVLMISLRCTHDIPLMYSWYPPDVLNTPRCTEHPPMYWTHIIQGDVAVWINVLIRCCKWLSFQSAEYNHHWWNNYMIKITQPKRPFSTFSFTERQWQYVPTYLKISYWYDYYKSHVVWQSVNKILAP